MTTSELYENFGRAMVQLEIAQGKVNELKQLIIQDMQKPKEVKEKVKE